MKVCSFPGMGGARCIQPGAPRLQLQAHRKMSWGVKVIKQAWYIVPVAGAMFVGFAFGHLHQRAAASTSRKVLYYVDPMHPAYHSDKPGTAPDCGMDLVPVYADGLGNSLIASGHAEPEG